jgi:hypothetical protein
MNMIIATVIRVFMMSLLFLPGMTALAVGVDASFFRARENEASLKKWLAG